MDKKRIAIASPVFFYYYYIKSHTFMEEANSKLPVGKENFSRDEVQSLLEGINKKWIARINALIEEVNHLKKQNEYWATEHEKSLVLIVDNASQKIELEELNEKLQEAFHQLEIESKTDYLTKLLNRGALIESLNAEIKRISRLKEGLIKRVKEIKDHPREPVNEENIFKKNENLGQLTCAILDLDHFKNINDTYGHLVGDKVLKAIGSILNNPSFIRGTDISGRFGGEEFLIVFPETNCEHAINPIQKIYEEIRQKVFVSDDNHSFQITVSIGVAEFRDTDKAIDEMIKRADNALYIAKQKGRDRIEVLI